MLAAEQLNEAQMSENNQEPEMIEGDMAEWPDEITIASRFGEVKANPHAGIFFPNGVLGFENGKAYVLTDFPTPKMNEHFRLLQSLEDAQLSFITMPLALENSIIEKEDLEKACSELGVDPEFAIILLIASSSRVEDNVLLTVNAKAPIIVDAQKLEAWQHVFSSDKYQMKHEANALIASSSAAGAQAANQA